MKRHSLIVSALIAACVQSLPIPLSAAPIDEFRLTEIENNIRALQTQLRDQARMIADLQSQLGNSQRRSGDDAARNAQSVAVSSAWLNAANWNRLRAGMSEAEVLGAIGPPTQMRVSDDKTTRTLLYALEIGGSGFLSGNVVLKDGQLASITKPALK